MLHHNVRLITSNPNKIAEFKRFGLPFRTTQGQDVPEVKGTSEQVLIYKVMEYSENILVEDTFLIVNNEEITDIKFLLDSIKLISTDEIYWVTSLAIRDDGYIYIYNGQIKCKVSPVTLGIKPIDCFGFDNLLTPVGSRLTLYELEKEGLKDQFSARKRAVENLLNGKYFKKIPVTFIPKWAGLYQG